LFHAEYGKREFEADMDNFIKVHTGQMKSKDTPGETDKISYNRDITKWVIGSKPKPDFNYFQKITSELLLRVSEQILKEDPYIIPYSEYCKEVAVEINIVNGLRRGYAAVHDNEVSCPGVLVIELSGTLCSGRMALPQYYLGKFDYSFLGLQIMKHEFRHQVEDMRKLYEREYRAEDKLEKWTDAKEKKGFRKGLLFLYTALADTFTEGIANFCSREYTQKLLINRDWMRDYAEELFKLATIEDKAEAREFLIQWLNVEKGPSTYYCGQMMCFFIGLAIAKKEKRYEQAIKIYPPGKEPLMALAGTNLNDAMNSNKAFDIDNIPVEIHKETVAILTEKIRDYRDFIKKYESSCKTLGLKEDNMILDWRTFQNIKKEAIKHYQEFVKDRDGKEKIILASMLR
jgi:hypothetical protein